MDQNDELNFEDILKEFAPEPSEQPEPPAEEPEKAVSGDTIRLDTIRNAMESTQSPLEQTREFPAVRIEEEPEPPEEPEYEEPEYDESIQTYNTPEPIIFRSKSRLKEIRGKLVSGPEKRYYTLSEIGVGKLQAAMVVNLLIVLLTAAALALFSVGIIPETRLRLLVFLQFLAMLLSALLGCYRLIDGVTDLIHLHFTPNSLLVLTFIVCCVDGVLCLQQLRISCCAAFSLEMTMAIWAEYHRRSTEMGQMDTLRRATDLEGQIGRAHV